MPDDSKQQLKTMKGSWYNQEHRNDAKGTSVSSRKIQTETKQIEAT